MPEDWLAVSLRFALYLDLMVLFGVSLFSVYGLGTADRSSAISRLYGGVAEGSALAGIMLSIWNVVTMAESMTGATRYGQLTSHVFNMILTGTAVGAAWLVRVAALTSGLLMAIAWRRGARHQPIRLAASGAIALATLAWAGHGAMDDGLRGALHLAADIVHLLAAGMWVGALVAFVLLSSAERASTPDTVQTLSRAASGFATIGTCIVGMLIATGVVNYVLVAGTSFDALFTTPYGWLLLGKLALFVLMLALAAGNRYRLSPRLAAAIRAGDSTRAVKALHNSLRAETCLAMLILALVAWLGMLSPLPA
ncbi:Copper resistance protein D [Ralstonia psammae]|uniref:Copper resistance protein D n=1 Tax=Ralstonia psammae TaxID=3058598 RepID=A0ABM9JEU4_9RALS|nr:copper homeostasis membrane protein CopD [Ralstonia sp. LMG 19083]CAJ0791718.1 Copper resistance protein D [Ralstonia sp. LMG 19083]